MRLLNVLMAARTFLAHDKYPKNASIRGSRVLERLEEEVVRKARVLIVWVVSLSLENIDTSEFLRRKVGVE